MDSTHIYYYTSSIRITFIKLVSLEFIFTQDRVFSTTSRSCSVKWWASLNINNVRSRKIVDTHITSKGQTRNFISLLITGLKGIVKNVENVVEYICTFFIREEQVNAIRKIYIHHPFIKLNFSPLSYAPPT